MHTVLILGAGKIGSLISGLLAESGDYAVQVADVSEEVARSVVTAHGLPNMQAFSVDARDKSALAAHLARHRVDAVISSLPFYCNVGVAEAARGAGAHYFDLTEDVEVTRAVRALADGATQAFVPQCGLAPGFVSIAANSLISHFDDAAQRQAACRRAAAEPEQRAQVLAHLVHRGSHQRIRQPVRGDRRRTAHRARAARGPRGNLDRRQAVRGVQHLRRAGLARRQPWRARAEHGLQDHPLPGPLRADAPADERPQAQSRSRDAEARARERRAADPAGRGHRLHRGRGSAGRSAARGDLREQDLSAGDRGTAVVRDPGDDRGGDHRSGRPRARRPRPVSRLRAAGGLRAHRRAGQPLRPPLRRRADRRTSRRG